MAPRILPDPSEYAALAPKPGGPVQRSFSDARMLGTAGYALVLQVAHPTVGYGVHQYSGFVKDPWGRLLRTLDYVHGSISGGPEMAGAIGARVRAMHKTIRGTRDDGSKYSAMEPDAFAWVHATLAAGVVAGRRHLARPMSGTELEAFWREWLGVGRLIGVRERDLPASWVDVPAYVDDVVETQLRWTPAIPDVLATFDGTVPPNLPGLHPRAWETISRPASTQLRVLTSGFLPPVLRERLDLPWTPRDQRLFNAIGAANRVAGPLMVGPLGNFSPAYVTWRRKALERGDVAGEKAVRQPTRTPQPVAQA